jgi:hypothetical protein
VRIALRIGVAGAFVLVTVGATFDALAVTAVLALLDRLGQRQETGT